MLCKSEILLSHKFKIARRLELIDRFIITILELRILCF